MRGGAVDEDGGGRPGVVGPVLCGRGVQRVGRPAAVVELGRLPPIPGERFEQRGLAAAGRRGPGWRHRDRLWLPDLGASALGQAVEDGAEQVAGAGHCPVHLVAGALGEAVLAVERLVEHRQAGLVGGAAALVEPAVDGGGEQDVGLRLGPGEQVTPVGVAGDGAAGRDGGEPPAGAERRVGCAHVAQVGVPAHAVEVRAAREGRVHEHDAGLGVRQQVADVLGVVAGDLGAGEAVAENPGAGAGQLVQVEAAAGLLVDAQRGQRGQHAGAGRRLEHGVAGADAGGDADGPGHLQRRGELLQADLLVAAAGLRGLERGDCVEQGQHRVGVCGLPQQGAAVADEQEHDGGLGRFVRVLPLPGALGVGGAEGLGQRVAQQPAVDPLAGLEGGQQLHGGLEQAQGRVRGGLRHAVAAGCLRGCGSWAEQVGGRLGGGVEHARQSSRWLSVFECGTSRLHVRYGPPGGSGRTARRARVCGSGCRRPGQERGGRRGGRAGRGVGDSRVRGGGAPAGGRMRAWVIRACAEGGSPLGDGGFARVRKAVP